MPTVTDPFLALDKAARTGVSADQSAKVKIEAAITQWAEAGGTTRCVFVHLSEVEMERLRLNWPGLLGHTVHGWKWAQSETSRNMLVLTRANIHYWQSIPRDTNDPYQGAVVLCVKCGASQCGQHSWDWNRVPCARDGKYIEGDDPIDALQNDWSYVWGRTSQTWELNPIFQSTLRLGRCSASC